MICRRQLHSAYHCFLSSLLFLPTSKSFAAPADGQRLQRYLCLSRPDGRAGACDPSLIGIVAMTSRALVLDLALRDRAAILLIFFVCSAPTAGSAVSFGLVCLTSAPGREQNKTHQAIVRPRRRAELATHLATTTRRKLCNSSTLGP